MDLYFGRAGIPPLAFTNPIWIDADGDGVRSDPGDPAPSPGTWDAVAVTVVDAGAADEAAPADAAPSEADAAAEADAAVSSSPR